MLIWMLVSISAVIVQLSLLALPPLLWCLLVTGLIGILSWIMPHKILMLIMVFMLSFSWAVYRSALPLNWHLPNNLIAKTISVSGRISSLPKHAYKVDHFNFTLTQFNHKYVKTIIRLSWYRPHPTLVVGDHWRLAVRLKPPSGLHNPGGFDYQRWLFMRGIRAQGYVVSREPNKKIKTNESNFSINRLRQKIEMRIQSAISTPTLQAFVSALTVGSRNLMANSQWRVFQNTGTSHLIAISGLHIGLVAGFMYFLFGRVWRLFPRLLFTVPATQAAAVAAIFSALVYALIAGFSLPTQRAVIMITSLMLAQLLFRATPIWRRLLFAFWLIVLWQPLALLSASFWLSFLAVCWIGYGMAAQTKHHKFKQWLRMQWVVLLGLFPITLYFFQQISLVAWLANAVAIPWIGFVIVPLSLLAVTSSFISTKLSHLLFSFDATLLLPLWIYLKWLAASKLVVWRFAIPNVVVLITTSITVAIVLAPKGFPARWLASVWLLPLLFYHYPKPKLHAVWMSVLDVGQGLSIVVRTRYHALLYDAGPRFPSGFDAGQSIVLPYLLKQGVYRLDAMIISHGDNDHIGGANAVLNALPTNKILTSVPNRFMQHKATFCHSGMSWRWDGVQFRILYPQHRRYQANNSSCVLQIDNGRSRILLPGDIERVAENELIKSSSPALHSTMIIVPHHGSKTSSSLAFLQQVNPQYALISAGAYNRYHLPASLVMQRYHSLHIQTANTAKLGALLVHMRANGRIDREHAYIRRHYWQN